MVQEHHTTISESVVESVVEADAAVAEAFHTISELGVASLRDVTPPGVAIVREPERSVWRDFVTDSSVFVPSVVFTFVTIAVVMGAITKIVATQARERTRREIAAYVAEGTMTPEQGERLLRSKVKDC